MKKPKRLNRPSKRLRSGIARGLSAGSNPKESAVQPTGGDKGAGLIRGMAVITRGEAIGHDGWIDSVFLSQVSDAINANPNGAKARFTHPGLSGDGLGKYTGRVRSGSVDGDVVRGDLHFSPTAHETPDGDLAAYLMQLAAEDPGAFGNSIAFDFDAKAEADFLVEHGAEWKEHEVFGQYLDLTDFQSPDPDNTKNLPHFRLAALHAVDAVDDPAANPNGLFRRGDEIASDAEKAISYALGLSADRPTLVALDIDPDRISGFLKRFLARNKLAITSTGETMPNPNPFVQRGKALKAAALKKLSGEKCMDDEDPDKKDLDDDAEDEKLDDAPPDKEDGGKKDEELDDDQDELEAEKESTDESIDDEEQDEEDADKTEGKDKSTDARQAKKMAKGGDAPKGSAAGDEGSRQDEYQADQEEEDEKGKKNAEEETPVGSPSSKKEKGIGPMGDGSNNVGAAGAKGRSQFAAEGKKFLDAFGEIGGVWFAQGKTFSQARKLYTARLKADNERLANENAELQKKLTGRRGVASPLSAGTPPPSAQEAKLNKLTQRLGPGMARFASGLRIPRASDN